MIAAHRFRSSTYWLKSFLQVCLSLQGSFLPGYELVSVESRWANRGKFITVHPVLPTRSPISLIQISMSTITFRSAAGTMSGSRLPLKAAGARAGSVQTSSALKFETRKPACVCSSRATFAASTASARRIPSL